ncbi:nuclear transport factor 2 family protein [Flavobacterium sp. F-65]|uniref:Nuclear transport factor 2 family protein n=1 Tax=Flavobacterium pisciphilum TaxID=2893755 RepID=A0ABS8MS11_9FLAO|nr:nuclear transport factor 2 family protein [Flavobacterium sp. F-65]MCC9071560.1 nuclear transport factor 2 family protein [Flavobacterium sp. F-65]
MSTREKIIQSYIDGYNQFDIDKMTTDFDETIVFENIQGGETNMTLTGLTAFKEQAEQAKTYFSTRTQTITSFKHLKDETEIEIDYFAILGMDFPNGFKKGQELNLKGKSIFEFTADKISKLTDIS